MTPSLRYSAVVFDLDGTLVDSYDALADAVNHCLAHFGRRTLTMDEIRTYVGEGVEVLLSRCFAPGDVPREASGVFEERYDLICCEQSRILSEVEETIAGLARSGVRMGVCTNKPTSFSRKILEHLGVAELFGAIVGPDLAGARKPDAAHVDYVLASIAAEHSGALFVGDMPIDVRAARNAGIDVAVIATGSSDEDSLRREHPDFVLARFSELTGIVGR